MIAMAERNPLPVSPRLVNDHSGLPAVGHATVLVLHTGQAGAGLVVARQTLTRPAFKAARVAVDAASD